MNKLWAPWRAPYIKNIKKQKGCLFCRAARTRHAALDHVFARTKHAVALLNLYPYNNGHAMVAPVRHVRSLESLSDAALVDIMKLVVKTQKKLAAILKPEGFNIGINAGRVAGAGIVHHIHIHIVPRWCGDTNFMTTTAGTKVISESLDALYQQLKNLR
jgi:ATP adenylyltransferase